MSREFEYNQEINSSNISANNRARQQQIQQQQSQPKTISNRQKILNLHQRIKMLDQFNLSGGQQNVRFNFQTVNRPNKTQISEQQQYQEQLNLKNQKSFLKRTLSPNPSQSTFLKPNQNNISNFFRSKNQKQLQKPNISLNSPNIHIQSSNQAYLNKSIGSQNNLSAPRLPTYSPSPKIFQQSQNISNSMYRSPQMSQITELYPLQAKYISIEDKFLQFKMSQQNLLKNIENQIQQLQESCKQIKKEYEKSQKRNEQEIDSLQKSLIGQINDLSAELKEVKKGAIQSLDTKHKAIRCETIAMIGEQFETQCSNATTEIQTKLDTTHKILQKQQLLRDETAQFLINSFGDQIIKIQEVFNNDRQARIRKNDELLKLINKVEDQLMDKLQKQKSQMISTIQDMQNMLQQVCYKIEQKILGN